MNDITAIFYTCNEIDNFFAENIRIQLLRSLEDIDLISVSHKPMEFGKNIVVGLPRHHLSIYRQALIGAKSANTKYIALTEDDVLYTKEHFLNRPSTGKFLYNVGSWNLQTWGEPIFTQKLGGRINLNSLICERSLFIEAMEERFKKWPDNANINISNWAEPGKYEKNLGVTIREIEKVYTNPPNIAFSHETALSFANLGKRKRLGEVRALEIPYWGNVESVIKLYVN